MNKELIAETLERGIITSTEASLIVGTKNCSWYWIKHAPDWPPPIGKQTSQSNRPTTVYPTEKVIQWLVDHEKIPPFGRFQPPRKKLKPITKDIGKSPGKFDNRLIRLFLSSGPKLKNTAAPTPTLRIKTPGVWPVSRDDTDD